MTAHRPPDDTTSSGWLRWLDLLVVAAVVATGLAALTDRPPAPAMRPRVEIDLQAPDPPPLGQPPPAP